jgi:hypothetical protein
LILLIFTHYVPRITGVSYWHLACLWYFWSVRKRPLLQYISSSKTKHTH